MAEINLQLFPKQELALNSPANEILYGGAAGGGKMLAEDGVVLTPFGFKENRYLKLGDLVNNPDGTVAKIIQLKAWEELPKWEITFHDGTRTVTNEHHLWLAWRSGKRKKRKNLSQFGEQAAEVVETKELKAWLDQARKQVKKGVRPNWPCIPVCQEQVFNVTRRFKCEIDPYLLGALLGDGHLGEKNLALVSGDMAHFRKYLPQACTIDEKPNHCVARFLQASGVLTMLHRVGLVNCLSHDKFIPEEFLKGSVDVRRALLQGLMDTDGGVESGRKCTYSTVSPYLRDGVAFLARSLGCVVTVSTKKLPNGPAYRLHINAPHPAALFRLPRKREAAEKIPVTPLYRRIVSIKKRRETFKGRCITVSHPNGLYITNDFIVTHNSHLMRVAAITWCYMIPNLQVYIFRRLSTDLYKNHMEGVGGFINLLQPWVKAKFVQIVQPGTIKFKNGARIFLNHCQYEHNVTQYQGTDIHVLMIDELTHWTESMYTFLRGRCRAVGISVPAELGNTQFPRILCGSNPGSVGHNWVKALFVDATAKGTRTLQTEKEDGGMLRAYIPAVVADNPALLRDDPGYLDRLEGLGNKALVRAMKLGDWDIVAGGMFDDVWNENAIVLPPFELPDTWTINRSYDHGESKPFSVGWWAETDDSEVEIAPGIKKTFYPKSLIRINEWYGWNGKPNVGCRMNATDIAKGILQRESLMELRGRVTKGPADSAIFDVSEGNSTALRMESKGVFWTKADKRPGSRIQGWSRMREMFENSAKVPMDGPGLFCFAHCEHFIRTIPTLPRDKKNMDDVDTEAEDHLGDDVRYRVWRKSGGIQVVSAGLGSTIDAY